MSFSFLIFMKLSHDGMSCFIAVLFNTSSTSSLIVTSIEQGKMANALNFIEQRECVML